ncbi:MAG: cysteinyl-tRNA synthetase [Icmadophila ericetorum]|nr:cysteinyl-tRNA synthetase [Icmadophila ericetorum]
MDGAEISVSNDLFVFREAVGICSWSPEWSRHNIMTLAGVGHENDGDASGSNNHLNSTFPIPPDISLKDRALNSTFRNYRKELALVDNAGGGNVPSVAREPPTAPIAQIAPWAIESMTLPATASLPPLRSFFDDSDSVHQLSPSYRPSTSRTGTSDIMESPWPEDERRPSVASSTTVGSQESSSKASIGKGSYHKKLAGFFGEDFDVRSSPQSSSTSIPTLGRENSNNTHRTRNNSVQTTYDGRPISPASSRPRTPLPVPSSDVVPWIFQDYKDIPQYGDAPVRQVPAGPDKQRYDHDPSSPAHHRFHFPGHKYSRSKEEQQKISPKETSYGQALRPSTSREDSPAGTSNHPLKEFISSPITPMTSRTTLNIRSSSPTPSTNSALSRDGLPGQRSPADSGTGKRGIFDKFRRYKGGDKGYTEQAKNGSNGIRNLPDAPLSAPLKRGRDSSIATFDSGSTIRATETNNSEASSHRKDSKARLLHPHGIFPTQKRAHEKEKEADKARNGSTESESLWSLDTNLNNMEGIVSSKGPLTPPAGGLWTGTVLEDGIRKEPWELSAATGPGAWDAPDSWAVRKAEDMARVGEIDEKGGCAKAEDKGIPYCMRVFRVDSTFATLSTSVNTPVSEVMQLVGKKSFMVDEINNYQIVMKKHDLQRQLALNERPIAIQKKLLEQAGYEEADRIEDIGREDNSYLCRFTFVPAKLAGYYSLEKDPEIEKLQKFSHVDLSGKSLVTIPIKLYKKAAEIISLNLSRNLDIDIPKDFVQSCGSLREIKFVSNEASSLPASISLAARLTTLDISNNRLEQLEHAELDKLQRLVSIKMSNNKLQHLPSTFGQFKTLRSLNISSNYLSVFPDFLCDLRSLVDLDISFNAIKELPKIGQLRTLERIWATNNMLEGTLPESFQDLENLKEIDIRFNGLTSIDVIAKLPRLEQLMAGHNAISAFEGSFSNIRILHLDHNPITRFDMKTPLPSLTTLNLASAKLSQLNDSFFKMVHNLNKMTLDKNHFVGLAPQIGELRKLEHLSIAKNPLNSIPPTIGNLQELRYLDVRECNLKKLPSEIWSCNRMHTLNISSNLLESFPKPPVTTGTSQSDNSAESSQNQIITSGAEALGKIEEAGHRRPSQGSGGLLSVGPSPAGSTRQNSIVSVYGPGGRKASVISRTPTDPPMPPVTRKDSSIAITRLTTSFAGSLRNLYIADNRLTDDVFAEITLLPELRVLNLSYNDLVDIPQRSLRRWPHLQELYLSGNTLTSLPYDDLEEIRSLRVLHLNSNKFQVLPAELGKVEKLTILDIGSNSLKYNISNWPYDWNWNWNRNLKYLNFSGNKRLEIKPNLASAASAGREETDLTNFNLLDHLRILGLMDVTLTIPSVPDETEDRRIRTSGSVAGSLPYGMADSLGRCEHLSIIDMVIPRFRGHDAELLMGMFDGSTQSTGGSKVAKYLHENFSSFFTEELKKIKIPLETPQDALRRTFLGLNKDLATAATQVTEERDFGRQRLAKSSLISPALSTDDLRSGSCATVIYLDNMDLYVANVGDVQAMLMHSDGGFRILTKKHDPALPSERERIREAGGYVSRHGKLNDDLEVSRAFGYIHMMPAVMAAPHITKVTLKEQDEIVLIASKELWDYVTPDLAVDVARSDRGDLMRASQKLRDLAMSFGCTSKIMVMAIGVSDLKRRDRTRFRGPSLSMGPSQLQDDQLFPIKRGKRPRDGPDDSTLARLDQEVDAPTGDLGIVFTDIKSSTLLWETYPIAMRSAIKIHNNIMRRQLRIIGGYEVKTEGDAFMVSFPTATSALLWCFSVQTHLLLAPWPQEILLSKHGEEEKDADGNVIFRGLSVRMSIHWGHPVCEPDPITGRMDYFGPMVNRTARIQGEADGGQIAVSSDFIGEIERTLETYGESDRTSSVGSDDTLADDARGQAIRRELRSLSSQGFEVKELGERRLKGLENPEHIFLMYPHTLAGRLAALQRAAEEEAKQASDSPATLPKDSKLLQIDMQVVWDLWQLSMRLERICSTLEHPDTENLPHSEQAMIEKLKNRGGDITDRFVTSLLENQIGRIELCVNTLQLRNLLRPFGTDVEIGVPVEELLEELKVLLEQKQNKRDLEKEREDRLVRPGPGIQLGEPSRPRSTPSPRPSSSNSTRRRAQPPRDGLPL